MNMEEKVHLLAAKLYLEIAEAKNKEYESEQELIKRIALRVVSAQNYFYAAINWIEAVFAGSEEHSFNHENRMSKLWEHRSLFEEEIISIYQLVERDQRNKVTYRGENGPKYENIKKLARLLEKKYGQTPI